MYVNKGKHEGLFGRVMKIMKSEGRTDRAQFKLDSSGEVVTLRCSELDEVINGIKSGKKEGEKKSNNAHEEEEEEGDVQMPPWLYSSIRVRVVSKSLSRGKFYLKKGTIIDVPTPTECVVQLDGEGDAAPVLVSKVNQSALETCVPKKPGGRIIVVIGKLRGRRGKLLKKSDGRDTARIQLSDDFSIHDDVDLDSIAEFVGEIDEHD